MNNQDNVVSMQNAARERNTSLVAKLVGEIRQIVADTLPTLVQSLYDKLDDGSFHINALTPIEEFNAYFESQFTEDDYDTLAGMLMKFLGHLPKRGESITIDRFLFKMTSADSRRIKQVQVSLLPESARVSSGDS